jgi:hypothetical protein
VTLVRDPQLTRRTPHSPPNRDPGARAQAVRGTYAAAGGGSAGPCEVGHRDQRRCQAKGARRAVEEMIPLTLPEVRRLLADLIWHQPREVNSVLDWSHWRRHRQARARR